MRGLQQNDYQCYAVHTMAIDSSQRLLTVAEVAERLKVHQITVRRYIASGRLRAVRLGGTAVRVREEELERLLAPVRVRTRKAKPSRRELARRRRTFEQMQREREATPPIGITTAELVRLSRTSRDWMYGSDE